MGLPPSPCWSKDTPGHSDARSRSQPWLRCPSGGRVHPKPQRAAGSHSEGLGQGVAGQEQSQRRGWGRGVGSAGGGTAASALGPGCWAEGQGASPGYIRTGRAQLLELGKFLWNEPFTGIPARQGLSSSGQRWGYSRRPLAQTAPSCSWAVFTSRSWGRTCQPQGGGALQG